MSLLCSSRWARGATWRGPWSVGHDAGDLVEIKRGLLEGERVVTEGGFVLKSELQR